MCVRPDGLPSRDPQPPPSGPPHAIRVRDTETSLVSSLDTCLHSVTRSIFNRTLHPRRSFLYESNESLPATSACARTMLER